MSKTILIPVLLWVCLPVWARADADLYPFPQIEDAKSADGAAKKKAKPVDPFVKALSKKTDMPEEILTETFEKGFGRTEIIRLILMSKRAEKPLPDLIKEREKGTKLATIAQGYGQDNRAVRREAALMLKELQKEEAAIIAEEARKAAAVAGVNGTLSKGSTAQTEVPSGKRKP